MYVIQKEKLTKVWSIIYAIKSISFPYLEKCLVYLATSPSEQSIINHKKKHIIPKILHDKLGIQNKIPPIMPNITINKVIVFGITFSFIKNLEKKGDKFMQTNSEMFLERNVP